LVINNGRTPELFDADSPKEDFTLSVGRIWDAAKSVSLLLEKEMPGQVCIVGWEREPGRGAKDKLLSNRENVDLLGQKSQIELRTLFAKASIYAATSRYEPFGLAPLEAALSRCVLVMNDNPVFHELWGDAALYFQKDQPNDLARVLADVRHDVALRSEYANRSYCRALERFTAQRMVEEYESVYQQLCSHAGVA
jgi:glycosyltransferase involved in cell wall biosynthesis